MHLAISARALEPHTDPRQAIDLAADAGFDAVELATTPGDAIDSDGSGARCRNLAAAASGRGVPIVALAAHDSGSARLAAPGAVERAAAVDRTLRWLDRAAALGAQVLSVATVAGSPTSTASGLRHADALHHCFDALERLRFEAETRRVALGIEAAAGRLLNSPPELVDFVDRINSPSVGVVLDAAAVVSLADPVDWIETLGRRILGLRVSGDVPTVSGPDDSRPVRARVDWPSVADALRAAGFRGPLIYGGREPPAAALQWMRRNLRRDST